MYARLTLLEIDTVRTSMAAALGKFEAEIAPRLREQPGYQGVFVLSTPEGKGVLLSMWDTEDQAAVEGDHQFYAEALGSFTTLFRSPPGRERYEVVYTDQRAATSVR
jgi:heme-degrading monooxygenase HmoA